LAENRGSLTLSLQFFRFLVVGALNTIFGYSIFAILIFIENTPTLALIMTYSMGVFFNFFTTRRFVFNSSKRSSILRFIVAYILIYFFNLGLYKLIELVGAPPLVTQALCLPVIAIFSFMLFKFQVFRNPS
jgi:putative flippase GtrA